MSNVKKILPLCLFFVLPCFSAERALLDALVDKGVLTPAERSEIAKEMSAPIVSHPEKAKSVKLSGRFQIQYESMETEGISGPMKGLSTSGQTFLVRRMFLHAAAELGGGWSSLVSLDLARGDEYHYLIDTYVQKKIDTDFLSGNLDLGYKKVYFLCEENMSSFRIYALEWSMVTSYWSGGYNNRRLGIGGRNVGVFWFGDVKQVKGLSYAFQITNAYQDNPTGAEFDYLSSHNDFNYWGNVAYAFSPLEGLNINLVLNLQYSPAANHNMGVGPYGSVMSINPYIKLKYGGLSMYAEYVASQVEYGARRGNSYVDASPYGVNFSVEYLFDIGEWGKIGPVFRYSWLDTGGRGVAPSDGNRHAENLPNDQLYNNGQSFYAGLTWQISEGVVFRAGYQINQYSGTPENRDANHCANSSSVRAQMQVWF